MKKNGKTLMIFLIILFLMVLTWFVPTGTFNEGAFVSNGTNPAGIFDLFVFVYYAFTYKAMDIIYILMIGGAYGVLSNVAAYKKCVDKAARLVKKYDVISLLVVTLLVGLFTSMTNEFIVVLGIIPFIVTVFLKAGKDKLTATSAGFGGLFIGIIGKTFSTYGVTTLIDTFELTVTTNIVYKVILFILAYGLYNLFAILHMKKIGSVDHTKYDAYCTEVIEKEKKGSKKKAVWPFITVSIITVLIGVIAFISWETSFGITLFSDLYKSITSVELFGNPIFKNLLGSATAFGSWTTLFLNVVILLGLIIVALVDRMPVKSFITNFQNGARKIYKLAFIYVLVNCVYVLFYYFPIGITILNGLLGNGSFNVFVLFIVGFVGLFLAVDYELVGSALSSYLAVVFAEKAAETTLVLYLGMSIAAFIVPTSYLLMLALTYLDIPYTKWLKYIWKFLLAMVAASLIVILLVCVF